MVELSFGIAKCLAVVVSSNLGLDSVNLSFSILGLSLGSLYGVLSVLNVSIGLFKRTVRLDLHRLSLLSGLLGIC